MNRLSRFPVPITAAALFLFVPAVLFQLVAYVLTSRQYPQWDEHQYMSLAVSYADILMHPQPDSYGRILAVSQHRQPVFGLLLSLPILAGYGLHAYTAALILGVLLFCGTVIGVYMVARHYLERLPALLAAVVFGTLGNALFYAHFAYSETATSFFCIWALYFLLKSDGFTRFRYAAYAGMLLGTAWLTRWVAPVFLAGPIIICAAAAVAVSVRTSMLRRRIMAIGVFCILAFVVPAVLYYIPNAAPFIDYVTRNQGQGAAWVAQYRSADMANTLSTRSVMYYFNILSQNTVWVFVPFCVGILVALRYAGKYGALLAGFLVPYGFFTAVTVWKEDRFIVPMYTVFSIIIAIPFAHIGNRRIRSAAIAAFMCLTLAIGAGALWGMGPFGKRGLSDVVLPAFIHHPRRIYLTPLVWTPTKEYVNADRLVDMITADWKRTPAPVVVLTYPHEPLENAVMSIISYERRNAMTLKTTKGIPGYSGVSYAITQNASPSADGWRLVGHIDVPIDASAAYVYRLGEEPRP